MSEKRIKYIPYRGDKYRDDRMFVFNIVAGKLEEHSQKRIEVKKGYWVLYYRNNLDLTLCDKKFFKTKDDAERSVKFNEPLIPLISNFEEPYDIFKGEYGWDLWIEWLSFRGLHSAISGYQNFPLDVTPEGGSFIIGNSYKDISLDRHQIN
jgi:hypothetical protein